MFPAPLGNKRGIAVKDPIERQKAFESYCDHIASGYPKAAWFYLSDTAHCSWETMEKYIKDNPNEFDAFFKDRAHSQSYKDWFDRGRNLSDGKVKGNPSPQTWATIMRNMFHWDKDQMRQQSEDKLADLKAHALHDEEVRKKLQETATPESPSI